MSKAAIPFAVLVIALFVSSAPSFAKGGSNGAGKAFAGAGAGRPPGYTGNSPGAGAGRPPGYTGNSSGAGAGRPPGYTGNSSGAGTGKI